MYIESKITVKINSSNITHYKKYYNYIKKGDSIDVHVDELTEFSKADITVKCDDCGIIKIIPYKYYKTYGYKEGEYFCRKCKSKRNNLEKYGVENVFQLEETKNKSKKTNLKKYGVEFISQSETTKGKVKKTNLEKYGCEHHLQNKNILNKQKNTVKERYGVENISQIDEIKDKKVKTCLENNGVEYIFFDDVFKKCLKEKNVEKYGVEYTFQSEAIKKQIKKTNLEKYGVENASKNEVVKEKIKKSILEQLHNKTLENRTIIKIDSDNRMFEIHCDNCKQNFEISYFLFYKRRETNTCVCTICNPVDKHQSGLEILLQLFIKENYKDEILFNHRIEGKELDLYLPALNLAFEFNDIYWHSELYKSRNYHKVKSDICNKNGIRLIHIWEDDWLYKNNIVKSMILNKLGKTINKIFARNCEVKEIKNNEVIKEFLNKNHIQGYVGSSIKIGLYFNDRLVSLMCFKKSKDYFELNRFCNLLDTVVIGGASKLFKYFLNNYNSKIITFSNNSYSNGNVYEKLSFKKMYDLKPDYHYVVSGIRVHKFNFRNKNTDDIYRIYDAGKVKYIYEKTQ